MISALLVLAGGLSVFAAVLVARWLDARQWAGSLRAYRLHLPASLTAEDVTRWLTTVGALTHPPSWSLLPLPPVCLEVVGTRSGVHHYLLLAQRTEARMLSGLRAALPGVRIEEATDYLAEHPAFMVAAEATTTSERRPLSLEHAEVASTGLLAALQPVPPDCEVRLSWTLTSGGTPRAVPEANRGQGQQLPWWLESSAPADADEVRAERIKHRDPLVRGVLRLGVAAPTKGQAFALFGRVWPVLHAANAPGVRVVRRWLPSSMVARRMRSRALPITRWPVLGNVRELAGLLALPLDGVRLPGVSLGAARQLPPAPHLPTRGAVLGVSNYPGMTDRQIALSAADRLMHQFTVGPTGSGKSALITRMVVQDFAHGFGGAVFDPKGDLITDILARLPEGRLEDVIVLDAHDRARPVGYNLLGASRDEVARELVVDNVLHIFRSIWAEFWGPRTDQILRAALSTLASARAGNGSAFTIAELPTLLTNPSFRAAVLARTALPDRLRDFWQRFDAMSDGEQAQAVSPVLNKVDAFVQRVPASLMLGQSRGIDLRSVFTQRKLLLVSLAKGALGSETSNLLGSLLVASLWQAALSRVQMAPERRQPVFAYIDEAQDVMRLPIALADVLSQARGLGLGLTLANQYFGQLPEAIKAAVLGTVRTSVAFAVDHDDAKLLEKRYAPLNADDLAGLGRFEAAARCCVDGQTLPPVTLTTLPPDPPLRNPTELAATSRERYGVPRAEVEAAMRRRLQTDQSDGNGFGRVRHTGGPS